MRGRMPSDWRVPEVLVRRLGDGTGRQRAMEADGHLLLVLHAPPRAGEPERTGRLFWRDPAGNWRSTLSGEGTTALRRHVAEFADRTEKLEGGWQKASSARDYFLLLREIAPLYRTSRNLHATLQKARETMSADLDLLNARDQAGEVERALELLQADAKNGLEFTVAHQAEEEARRSFEMAVSAHRLNLLAAAFFPIATLAAVFGMNLPHGMEGWSTPAHFWGIIGLGMAWGLVLALLIARKPRPSSTVAAGSGKGAAKVTEKSRVP